MQHLQWSSLSQFSPVSLWLNTRDMNCQMNLKVHLEIFEMQVIMKSLFLLVSWKPTHCACRGKKRGSFLLFKAFIDDAEQILLISLWTVEVLHDIMFVWEFTTHILLCVRGSSLWIRLVFCLHKITLYHIYKRHPAGVLKLLCFVCINSVSFCALPISCNLANL